MKKRSVNSRRRGMRHLAPSDSVALRGNGTRSKCPDEWEKLAKRLLGCDCGSSNEWHADGCKISGWTKLARAIRAVATREQKRIEEVHRVSDTPETTERTIRSITCEGCRTSKAEGSDTHSRSHPCTSKHAQLLPIVESIKREWHKRGLHEGIRQAKEFGIGTERGAYQEAAKHAPYITVHDYKYSLRCSCGDGKNYAVDADWSAHILALKPVEAQP